MGKHLRIAVVAVVLLGLAGCATAPPKPFRQVSVNSLAALNAKDKHTYFIGPGNKGIAASDLQYQEYGKELDFVLRAAGFVPADSAHVPDVVVILSYGMDDPKVFQSNRQIPIWGETGVASAQTYGTAMGDGAYTATTTFTPSFGITGYRTEQTSVALFTCFAHVEAYDYAKFKESKQAVELWDTMIVATATQGDFRQMFPLLMASGEFFFASSTPHIIRMGDDFKITDQQLDKLASDVARWPSLGSAANQTPTK